MKRTCTLTALLLCASFSAHSADTWTIVPAPTAQSYYDEARASLKANKWRPALENLKQAVLLAPDSADIHNLLGYSYRKQGNLDKAFEHYGIALRLDPKHVGAHEYLGETYLLNKDLPSAEKHLASLEALCGQSCDQYRELRNAIDDYKKDNDQRAGYETLTDAGGTAQRR